MIQGILGFTTKTNNALSSAELREPSSVVLNKVASWLGSILSLWSKSIVSLKVYGLTNEELCYILRWFVFSSMESLLTTFSPIYDHVSSDSIKLKIQNILLAWVKESLIEGRSQYNMFGLSDEEIQMAILDSREKEKNSIIKEIDDEKDPDLKAVIKMQLKLGIGRYNVPQGKAGAYNAETWDFLQGQRDRMGVVDVPYAQRENAIGFDFAAQPQADAKYDTYAVQAEDE
jgi:hypothetical protein